MGRPGANNPEGQVVPLSAGGESGLLATIRQLSRARTQEQVTAIVSHAVRTLLHADGATFVLRDGDRCFYADEDAISPLWKGRRFPMSACVSGWCMTNDRAIAIADIFQDHRIPADAYRPTFVRSLAMAPVRLDEPVAALGAYWSQRRQPSPEELDRLRAIADAAALAVANLRPRRAEASSRRRPARTPSPKAEGAGRSGWAGPGGLRGFVGRLRNNGLRNNSLEAFAFAALCVAVATSLRLGLTLSGVGGLLTYATYYPAVLIAVLFGGRWPGVLAAALGGLAGYWFFMPPVYRFAPLSPTDPINLALYALSSGLIVWVIDRYKRAVLRLRDEDARHLTLAREQHHRVRNAAAVAESIVTLSLRGDPEEAKAINRRIRAGLAEVDVQGEGAGQPLGVRDLLAAELQPYDLSRFALVGDAAATLPARVRNILSLAIHELATNALKYGALSVPGGHVTVAWRVGEGRATLGWREAGGPPVKPPQRRGYGSILLNRLMEAAGGGLTLDFLPTGVKAEISLSLEPARA